MARPRVFVSSTFYDLKHIRASLEVFIESLGFDAVLFEKGDISFHPDVPLDESCYREAATADIFVLIIGGRYGSATSGTPNANSIESSKIYESITKKEFESAQAEDVPTFILLDSAVAAEYQTYLRNRDNKSIVYAHVDSDGVFRLLDSVFEKSKNNPVFNFDRATQIENWLREQWSGLFRELLRSRSQQKQLTALNSQVSELKSINDTLKTYLEAVLTSVKPDQSEQIIRDQESKLEKARIDIGLEENPFYRYLVSQKNIPEEISRKIITDPTTADEVIQIFDAALKSVNEDHHPSVLRKWLGAQKDYNKARKILEKGPINFKDSSYQDVALVATGSRSPDALSDDVRRPAQRRARKQANEPTKSARAIRRSDQED